MDVGELGAALVDLVLPGRCGGCAAPGPAWCPVCQATLGPPMVNVLPAAGPDGPLTVLTAGRYRGPLRTALLAYKERGRRDLAAALAELLAAPLAHAVPLADAGLLLRAEPATRARREPRSPPECSRRDRPTTWLVPAPSRPAAARARGGDHVLRLCRLLAAHADPLIHGDVRVFRALRLTRRARDSVGLDAGQRAANLTGRLRIRRIALLPPGARLLLVDDVVTTGATLRACRATLAAAGLRVDTAVALCDATGGSPRHSTRARQQS